MISEALKTNTTLTYLAVYCDKVIVMKNKYDNNTKSKMMNS